VKMTVTTTVVDGALNIALTGSVADAVISAFEIRSHHDTGDPFLHVVIDAPRWAVDYEGAGSVSVGLKGSGSHTHELGRQLTSWVWREGSTQLGTTPDIVTPLAVGAHTVSLTIADDNSPPRTLTGSVDLDVFPITAVGGALARYFPAGATSLETLLAAPPEVPGYVEVLSPLEIAAINENIGNSPFTSDVLVVLTGNFRALTAATYEFSLEGGSGSRLYVNGVQVTGPISLAAGAHAMEARFAISTVASLPATVRVKVNGGALAILDKTNTTHDQSALPPFINSLSGSSTSSGGGSVTLHGIGFFPSGAVSVLWDGLELNPSEFTVSPESISVIAPPGTETVSVVVQTPNGQSNSLSFTYLLGAPIQFATQIVATPAAPTQGAWGPDGRLYVGTLTGAIHAYTFDDSYTVIDVQTISAVSGLSNNHILGIAFNPFDPPTPVKIYVSHSELFANGGSCFTGTSAYSGQVSLVSGPSFSAVEPLVTGLPVSNHDHGINGLTFDNEGDLLIAVGGNTNAGVEHCNMGALPESPLSAAILKARISKAGFNGAVTYQETASGVFNDDQTAGHLVDVSSGVDVEVFSAGLRNPFDLVWTTRGALYGTDNGPNTGFGAASTSATTETDDPNAPDEILFLVEGHYYGHPNRNRGRRDDRQNVYRSPSTASLLGLHTAQLATMPPSTNGIDEYRATAFEGSLRGQLLVQHWNGQLSRAELTADGLSIASVSAIAGASTALDVVSGPGGAIIGVDYTGNALKVSLPEEPFSGMQAYDIFPWRARPDTSTPFVIGGVGFGSDVSVTIGGLPAGITSVSPTRIRGTIPLTASPTSELLDVVVDSGAATYTITEAFRYVLPKSKGQGGWSPGPQLPVSLGEVSGGIINGVMYMVGHGSAVTLAYDLARRIWITSVPQRPFQGDHHAAEVIDGKLYLFGGIGGGSEGKVQIFNPDTQQWTLGTSVPFATGSASTALIDGKVYVAGGIVGGTTVTDAAVYDPKLNSWTTIAPMPLGRNHAAAGTNGSLFFVFGGRGPGSGDGNVVADGFDDTQIYNPATNTWVSSSDPGSSIQPLPQKRGGMGKAAFFGGEFYVIGGETTSTGSGQVAGNVYNRVDVYNPTLNTWRLESSLPTARHGIFPLAYDGKIFVAGGGVQAGHSASAILEVFAR
jgi:N-acetylneuraminic acid mutarotase/glucose/arabinose dehydrogenase